MNLLIDLSAFVALLIALLIPGFGVDTLAMLFVCFAVAVLYRSELDLERELELL